MDYMKFLPFAATLFWGLLSSCQLSSEKAQEEATESGSIPPPKGFSADAGGSLPPPREELPDLTVSSEPNKEPQEKVDVIKMGDFEFKDVLGTLPSERELAAPPASILPPSKKSEGSQLADEVTQPLVTNP